MKLASDSANADYQLLIRAPVSTAARTILSVPGGTIRLVMGLPQRYTVMPGVPANFLFGLTSTNATQVVLTPLSINTPDMTLQRPRAPNAPYNYSSGYITFAPMAKELDKGFKIVVSSANETTFSIVVAPIGVDTMPIMLLDGAMPQQGKLHQYTEQYFVFHTPSTLEDTAVTFSLDSISGDADIYVNPGPHGFYHKTRDITDNPDLLPVWVSQIPSGRDAITIKPDDPDYQFQGGVYLVTVYGFRATEFVLRASSADAVVTLQEGLEIHGNVLEGGYQYFRFHDSQPYQTIMFDLQPTGGDADLYVSCMLSATGNVEGYPSKAFGHYNFSSIAYMEDALAISPWDPKSCSYQSSGTEVFYIAVYGYSDAAFSLNAMHGGGIRTLVAGVPLIGNVFAHMSMYYRIRVGSEAEDLRISLTTQFGDADLYVKINGLASNYDYDYRSGNIDTTVDEVFIPEQTICQNCIISVVVFGYRTSKYSLVASFNDRTILLYNGVPLKGSVEEDMVQYYAYQAVGNGSIHAVLTPQSGAPSLYMSRSAREPNATTSDTMSDDTDARLGNIPEVFLPGVSSGQTVYIGVAGAGLNSSYAVRVSEIPSDPTKPPTLLTLLDGIPQVGNSAFNFFFLLILLL